MNDTCKPKEGGGVKFTKRGKKNEERYPLEYGDMVVGGGNQFFSNITHL